MNLRVSRRLIRLAGWLLTPVVVWVASFLGGWIGAIIAGGTQSEESDLVWLVGGAVLGGTLGLFGWRADGRLMPGQVARVG